jgi:hypothetical protein
MDEELYNASFEALTQRGVPVSAAERASSVVANDQPQQPNLGRTDQDQQDVQDAMTWLNAKAR